MSFVILHLSDAHLGRPETDLDSDRVIRRLLEDLRTFSTKLEPSLLVFNGDLAFGEVPSASLRDIQYPLARRFLDSVLEALGRDFASLPVLIVPGNHDINRNKIGGDQSRWVDQLKESEAVYQAMQEGGVLWKRIRERQEDWYEFVSSLSLPHWTWDESLLMCTGHLRVDGCAVGVVGLNSSWASDDADRKGRLWIGNYQLQKAEQHLADADYRVAVAHHPTAWLHEAEASVVEQELHSIYDLFLHGHDHATWVRPLKEHLQVAAGACYQGSTKANSYAWIDIDLESKAADVHLRKYNHEGGGGWTAHSIPGKTDGEGVWHVGGTTDVATASPPRSTPRRGAAKQPGIADVGSVAKIAEVFERLFEFKWVPGSFDDSANSVVYWPVRVRPPTPIHAVQTYAAAGMQKMGAKIALWLDDLGRIECDVDHFWDRASQWFERAGGDPTSVEIRRFGDVLASRGELWSQVHRWLTDNNEKLDRTLKVSKLWPQASDADGMVAELATSKSRRLLTPPLVWTCLLSQQSEEPGSSLLTLGGYDERPLWQAWSGLSQDAAAAVGHLYIPQLADATSDTEGAPLHMAKTPIAWVSRADILEALSAASEAGPLPEHAGLALEPWCFYGFALLPAFVAGQAMGIADGGPRITRWSDLAKVATADRTQLLADEINRWLL